MPNPEPRRLFIIGAGGHASEIAAYVEASVAAGAAIQLVGIIDELRPRGVWHQSLILGSFDALAELVKEHPHERFGYITAVGTNCVRERFVQQVESIGAANLEPVSLIHPLSSIGPRVYIAPGTCIAPGCVVTTNVTIGRHCILNVNVSVSHDSIVGDFTNLNPGVSVCGNVSIGKRCYIGAGTTIIDKISIGDGAIIGAGAVVVRDIPGNVTAMGIPARVTKALDESLTGDR